MSELQTTAQLLDAVLKIETLTATEKEDVALARDLVGDYSYSLPHWPAAQAFVLRIMIRHNVSVAPTENTRSAT